MVIRKSSGRGMVVGGLRGDMMLLVVDGYHCLENRDVHVDCDVHGDADGHSRHTL